MASETLRLLQQQFNVLEAKREAILKLSTPIREERDLKFNAALAERRLVDAQIKEIEKDLFEIDTERALLARALGGKRMSDAVA